MDSYLIFDNSEIDFIDFNLVDEDSKLTIRKSVDKTKSIISWEGVNPYFVANLSTKSKVYNYSEIIQIVITPEWQSEIIF